MRPLIKPLLAALLLPSLAVAADTVDLADGIEALTPEIDDFLGKQLGTEGAKDVKVYVSHAVRGDIDGDGRQDTFIAYSLPNPDGGNFTVLRQALFVETGGKQVLRAERDNGTTGTATGRSFTPQRIEAGRITGVWLSYADGDGACCPSLKRPGELHYRDGKLVEDAP